VLGWGRGAAGDGARWTGAPAVAGAPTPASSRPGQRKVRRSRLQGFLVKWLGALVATEMAGGGGYTAAAALSVIAVVLSAAAHGSCGEALPRLNRQRWRPEPLRRRDARR
jgi:hypothetical protein